MDKNTWQILNHVNEAIIKIRGAYATWTSQNNVNYYEMLIFYSLRNHARCTQKQICNNYRVPKQSINNVINALKKEGYIRLVQDEQNKREKILELTESGRIYANHIMEPLLCLEEEAVREMGQENIKHMIELTNRYGNILERLMIASGDEKSIK